MNKTSRMMVADAIQEVFTGELTIKQRASIKKVVEHIGDSLLIDTFCSILLRITPKEDDLTLSYVVTKIARHLSAEVLFKLIEEVVTDPKDIKYLMSLLEAKNKFVISRISDKVNGFQIRVALNRLFFMLDASRISSRSGLRKVLVEKKRVELINRSKALVMVIRPIIELVVRRFIASSDKYEIVEVSCGKSRVKYVVTSTQPLAFLENYMYKTPQGLLRNKLSMNIDNESVARAALEQITAMPFTMDEQYNKAIMSILDTELFVQLMRGKSKDEVSTQAKVAQIRHSTTEGLRFWEEVGKGTVYFQYVLDFRGRVNQIGGISSVGNKVGKAMLRSGVKYPLGPHGYEQLLIGLASAMGHDKETFKERLKWGRDNARTFAEFGNQLLLAPAQVFNKLRKMEADDAFTAAAIALELHRIDLHHGSVMDYESDLFIGYDATSSAVQLVGLIMGNDTLTEASNVRVDDTTENKIHDAYMLMSDSMDKATDKAKEEATVEGAIAILDQWLGLKASHKRKIAKPLLMTRLYGSKLLTHMKRSKEAAVDLGLHQVDTEELKLFGSVIAKLFNHAFNREQGYNALRAYEDFVKAIAAAYSSKGMTTQWKVHSNSGYEPHTVNSLYYDFEGKLYHVYADGKKRASRTYNLDILGDCEESLKYEENYVLDKSKSKSAIAPNYIHSHDALVLYETVLRMGCPMRLTHDCFAAPVGLAHDMQKATTEVYADLFGDNNLHQLEKLQEECFANTGIMVELPEEYNSKGIPTDQIKRAIYAFS